MNPVLRSAAVLSLTAVLAACGQTTPPIAAVSQTAPTPQITQAGQPQDSYAARRAALPAQAPEPLSGQLGASSLQQTYPGGQPLHAQVLNKSVPLILVHGLMGWGTDEMMGMPYWGGLYNVVGDLRGQGYTVSAASVGPISSNWERAAELFAQIKGGCVDYGAAYSARYGFNRFDKAKCYPGIYPQWDAAHPINLLGHSMGGQTSRMLVKLLEDGSPADADGNNLFRGGRVGWVKAVITVSTPNSGTPATDNLQAMVPVLKDLLKNAAAGLGVSSQSMVYDFDLGQWGLRRQAGESFDAYFDRVMASHFGKNDSNAAYDLSSDGSAELNQFIGRSTHTIYASWATSATSKGLVTGWAYPMPVMFAPSLRARLALPLADAPDHRQHDGQLTAGQGPVRRLLVGKRWPGAGQEPGRTIGPERGRLRGRPRSAGAVVRPRQAQRLGPHRDCRHPRFAGRAPLLPQPGGLAGEPAVNPRGLRHELRGKGPVAHGFLLPGDNISAIRARSWSSSQSPNWW
ncbi:esterase/lipase family protein [Deinococcus radiodurans]|uniref:esterase/lipase family protein n=1 Tax=Deinococcus radiodurans TaxID=1299 RepID=UPI00201769D7|nr:triacylglycerol lipase [Deinococcus radiodurans]